MPPGCIICKVPFDAAVNIVSTRCGHLFHNLCIHRYFERSHTCPACTYQVDEKSLSKIFFHDFSNHNIERPVDTLMKQLRAKELKVVEKDQEIMRLMTCCATANKHIKQLHKLQIGLKNDASAIESKIRKLRPYKAIQQKLLQENKYYQCELQNMNNIKSIVEGCFPEAKKILMDMEVHVSSKEGKGATQRIATYCSVVKKEIAHLKEEKSRLQNEIMQLNQIGIFDPNCKGNIKQAKHHLSNAGMNSSLSAFCGPSRNLVISNNHSSRNSNLDDSTTAYCPSGKNSVATFTYGNPSTSNKNGQNMEKFDSFTAESSNQVSEPCTSRLATPALNARGSENDAVAQARYMLRNRAQIKRKIHM